MLLLPLLRTPLPPLLQVQVKRRADDKRFEARVVAVGRDCDLALLAVDDEVFWENATFATFAELPAIRDRMTVVGFPIGGEQVGSRGRLGAGAREGQGHISICSELCPAHPASQTDRCLSPRASCLAWKSRATRWRGESCWPCRLMLVRGLGWGTSRAVWHDDFVA